MGSLTKFYGVIFECTCPFKKLHSFCAMSFFLMTRSSFLLQNVVNRQWNVTVFHAVDEHVCFFFV